MSIGRGWTASNATSTSRNEIAFARNAVPGPNSASTSPATAGPKARAAVNCVEFSRIALSMCSGGTSCGMNDCQDAMPRPEPIPEIKRVTTISPGVAAPLVQSPQSMNAATIINACVARTTCFRGIRSASDPAIGPMSNAGPNAMNAAKPTQVVECVILKTTAGTVIVCIQLPEFETIAPHQKIE